MKFKKRNLCIALAAIILTSCSAETTTNESRTTSETTTASISVKTAEETVDTTKAETTTAKKKKKKKTTTTATEVPVEFLGYYPDTDLDFIVEEYPDINFYANKWDGSSAYTVVNDNKPFFTKLEKETDFVFEEYSDLDSLGRCGTAYANVCKEIMPTEERGKIGMIKPSGWQTSKYDKDVISDMYLFNRCHLIAYMLAGENANEQNLITGTRYLNMDGMLTFEALVDDYIEANPDNHVLYRVTPMYKGDDLVAQGVLMEGWSLEDKGSGVCYCVYCYNVQPYITIDYSNGNNHLNDDYVKKTETTTTTTKPATTTTTTTTTASAETEVVQPVSHCFVLNTNTKKIHCPECRSVSTIKPENYAESDKSVEELIAEGYTPCKICNPQ